MTPAGTRRGSSHEAAVSGVLGGAPRTDRQPPALWLAEAVCPLPRVPRGAVDPRQLRADEGRLPPLRRDLFEKTVTDKLCLPKDKQKVNTVKEKFLAHIYNGITIAQKFNL